MLVPTALWRLNGLTLSGSGVSSSQHFSYGGNMNEVEGHFTRKLYIAAYVLVIGALLVVFSAGLVIGTSTVLVKHTNTVTHTTVIEQITSKVSAISCKVVDDNPVAGYTVIACSNGKIVTVHAWDR